MAEAENTGAAPEEIEAGGEQAEDQRIAHDAQHIAVDDIRQQGEKQDARREGDEPGAVAHARPPMETRPCGRKRTMTIADRSTSACASDGEIW